MKTEYVINQLKEISAGMENAIEWGNDCMNYAMEQWSWKYGYEWEKDKANSEAVLDKLKSLISELEAEYEKSKDV